MEFAASVPIPRKALDVFASKGELEEYILQEFACRFAEKVAEYNEQRIQEILHGSDGPNPKGLINALE